MEINYPPVYCFEHYQLMFDSISITKQDLKTRKLWLRVECVNISERAILNNSVYTEFHFSLWFSDSTIFYQDEPGVFDTNLLYQLSPDEEELHAFLTPLIQHTQFQEEWETIHRFADPDDQLVLQQMLELCQRENIPLKPTDDYKPELNKRRMETLFKKPIKE